MAMPFASGGEYGQILVPAGGQLAALHLVQAVGQIWKLFGVIGEEFLPFTASIRTARADMVLKMLVHAVGHEELRVFRPAVILFHQLDFRFAEGFAVRFIGILLVWRAVADVRIHNQQRRAVAGLQECLVAARQLQQIVGIGHARDVPAIPDEPWSSRLR